MNPPRAKDFVENEKQFHLGFLPTEQSNPITAQLSSVIAADVEAGLDMLLDVDARMHDKMLEVLSSEQFARLTSAMVESIRGDGRIFFSGCGATGRLSILLDACWRGFWQRLGQQHPDLARRFDCADMESRSVSVMTGGDRALIRSVENLEDYASLGRQQMKEWRVGPRDTVVAITEGGETSSVLGTALEAVDAGAKVFLAFNNPADLLAAKIERSRQAIENPAVTVLDLCCGPMAVAGSTRMQATTIELLIVACALETALHEILSDKLDATQLRTVNSSRSTVRQMAGQFANLVAALRRPENLSALAELVRIEQSAYESNGLVTYLAGEYMLDILTDTTERAPTFMLPPFRKSDDTSSPPSWAFVKNPLLATIPAWSAMLKRQPRGISWMREMYVKHGAAASICDNPPRLDNAEIYKFDIGNEENAARWSSPQSVAIAVLVGDEVAACAGESSAFSAATRAMIARREMQTVLLAIGAEAKACETWRKVVRIACELPPTAIELWRRLAVKLVLNTLSTATMARMKRIYGNWMAYAETTNKKLVDRAVRLIRQFTGLSYEDSCDELFKTLDAIAAAGGQSGMPTPPTVATVERVLRQRAGTACQEQQQSLTV